MPGRCPASRVIGETPAEGCKAMNFVEHFAAGVDPARARVLHAVQQPLTGSSFTDVMGVPAWRSLPTWYLVAQQDQAIPPDGERLFASRMGATTVEVAAGHLAMISHPRETADLITQAVRSTGGAAATD